MTDKTSTRRQITPNSELTMVTLNTGDSPTLTGGTDTLTLTLADYGIKNVLVVKGFVHTTDNSVIVEDAGTSAVSGGVLTYTTETANNNKKRVVLVVGTSIAE